ncbi:ABC transporter permease [Mobiluncus mulieris]|nr:FtsX-like permease family protein [Mobiluncus mulieris]EEZ91901.1 efflux ABC transporter, permease protein [Mobiluncus mulieris 28-1]EFN92286.1 efflux ABC transporter, permease protein [Mobiluncus mulieris FB024-16]MBB5846617.1 putative ABC transport system permease protein [Mobiluncus mulieris]MCU9968401.1 FtsX-like permease family protein [Mobiluncus mulieris]MCU9970407.1 FtsX-like permease family protein [Mobiluncus mulieris]
MTRRRMYLRIVAKAFIHRLSRTFIALLSIATGSATLCALLLLAYTVPGQLANQLRSYGANVVMTPTGSNLIRADLMPKIDRALHQTQTKLLGRAGYRYASVLYGQQSVQVLGTNMADSQKVRSYWKIEGKLPAEDEILVGSNAAEKYRLALKSRMTLTSPKDENFSKNFGVSGILRTGGAEDDLIVMDQDVLAKFLQEPPSANVVEFSIPGSSEDLKKATTALSQVDPDNASAQEVRRISKSEDNLTSILRSLIWLVSSIISVLTLIGVSTTLVTMVNERAKEIGLKKALGAMPKQILVEFIGESILTGLVGGIIGSAAGIWIAKFVTHQAFAMDIDASKAGWPLTIIFAVLITVVGMMIPARRIVKIQPAYVLGGE